MERRFRHSQIQCHSQAIVPASSDPAATQSKPAPLKPCHARKAKACLDRDGLLESGRRRDARYCHDCAPIMKRIKSAEYKRNVRFDDWRKYRDDYYGFFNREDERAYRREYMKALRAWSRSREEKGLSWSPEEERKARRTFIHNRLEPWRQRRRLRQPTGSALAAA